MRNEAFVKRDLRLAGTTALPGATAGQEVYVKKFIEYETLFLQGVEFTTISWVEESV
jgi:hypothetical protein